jgi:tRNA G18 (ribose-2'-O)-methylase SpoU
VVLEGSNDHENIGVVARSARALGMDGLVLDPRCADPYYRRAVRVSMGEILHLPIVRCDSWPEPLDAIAAAGFRIWALTPDPSACPLAELEVPDRVALVAGAEGPGLSAAALARIHTHVRIPMHHGVDSLNLGHALAIAMAAITPPVRGG